MTFASTPSAATLADDPPSRAAIDPAAAITARIDRLPVTRRLWVWVLMISLGGFFEIYDLFFMGYIAPGMARSGILATTTASFFAFKGFGAFVAATFAGLFIGTFGLGFLADRYGRRRIFTYSLLWYSIGSAIMAMQYTAGGLLFWRFVTGIGVGVEIIVIDAYITELVPHHLRGRAIGFNQTVMFAAAPVSALLSFWLVPRAPFAIDGWRWVVLAGSIGAVVAWFIRRAIPESPRWLAQVGRHDEAERMLQEMETRITAEYGKPLPAPQQPVTAAPTATTSFADVWKPPYRSRVIMLLVFNLFQAVGYYGFSSWVPTLLIHQGVTVTNSLLYAAVIALSMPIGPLLASSLADRVQRKWMIVASALAVIAFGLAFANTAQPLSLVIFGALIGLSNQFLSVGFHTYQVELFPTSVRCRTASLVYSASRVGAMLSGFLIASLLRHFGVAGAFVGIVSAMLIIVVAIGGFGPNSTGLGLDEI